MLAAGIPVAAPSPLELARWIGKQIPAGLPAAAPELVAAVVVALRAPRLRLEADSALAASVSPVLYLDVAGSGRACVALSYSFEGVVTPSVA